MSANDPSAYTKMPPPSPAPTRPKPSSAVTTHGEGGASNGARAAATSMGLSYRSSPRVARSQSSPSVPIAAPMRSVMGKPALMRRHSL